MVNGIIGVNLTTKNVAESKHKSMNQSIFEIKAYNATNNIS